MCGLVLELKAVNKYKRNPMKDSVPIPPSRQDCHHLLFQHTLLVSELLLCLRSADPVAKFTCA